MHAPSPIWELCTIPEKVFRKTMLGLMFGGQLRRHKEMKAREPNFRRAVFNLSVR